jgi:hypothetical protein
MPLFNPVIYKQTVFANVTTDTTTTSTTFVDLISTTIVVSDVAFLHIHATCCSSTADAIINRIHRFQVLVDGSLPVVGSAFGVAALALSLPVTGGIVVYTGALTAGSHTIKLQWKVSGSTGQVRPVTHTDDEHASLLICEVSA